MTQRNYVRCVFWFEGPDGPEEQVDVAQIEYVEVSKKSTHVGTRQFHINKQVERFRVEDPEWSNEALIAAMLAS